MSRPKQVHSAVAGLRVAAIPEEEPEAEEEVMESATSAAPRVTWPSRAPLPPREEAAAMDREGLADLVVEVV
jgi:hypothetical protein